MPLSTSGRNDAAAGAVANVAYMSLHTGDPGSTGTAEVTGGGYARQAVAWGGPTTGTVGISNDPVFSIPPGTTVTHYGLWTAVTGGTWKGGTTLTASETYTGAGTFTMTDNTITISP